MLEKDAMILLAKAGHNKFEIAAAAADEVVMAQEEPLREAIFVGDLLENIFYKKYFPPGTSPEWELDLVSPGDEGAFTAYTIPQHGYIPERAVEGDYIRLATYRVGTSIDCDLKLIRESRTDILGRLAYIASAGVTKKLNDDGMHTLITAAADRGVVVYDSDAASGQFTKRLVTSSKVIMRRNGGGNSNSLNRRKLTNMLASPEGIEDIRNWGVDIIDEITRREIFTSSDDDSFRLFDVLITAVDELGEGQEYQQFYTNVLGAQLATGDVELAIGLDLSKPPVMRSFVMPFKEEFTLYNDAALHRQQRFGYYGWGEYGFGVLDNRDVIVMTY